MALIPVQVIKDMVKKGFCSKYEFAEELGVTEDLFELAYNYYKENGYIL